MNNCPNCGKVSGLHSSILQGCMCQYSMQAPPQRTWVGLTDEEIDQGLLRTNYAMHTAGAWRDGVEWATKQLREKNNG